MKFDEKMFYGDDLKEKIEFESEKIVVKIIYELTKFRVNYKISQLELVKITGIPQKVISNVENLKVYPNIETLAKMYCGLKELVKSKSDVTIYSLENAFNFEKDISIKIKEEFNYA